MASRTAEQLAARVLENLNFARPGEDADVADVERIIDRYQTMHADLVDNGDAYWPVDAIPLPVFDAMGWLVAIEVAPGFGALPIVLQAIGASNAMEAKGPHMRRLRVHREADFNHEHEPIMEF